MHPDVPEEQAYFDHALDLRERLDANRDRAASRAADPKTAMELRRRVGALGVVDPGQAVAFGRIDADGDRWYIGRGAIWDESNDLVVVNWQAPVAAPFYIATAENPEGLDRRRIFRCRNDRILDIDELVFRQVAQAVAGRGPEPVVTDALLEALDGERSGHLADIVATIQAEQYEVIARDPEQLLIVQGAPGTGKTVVGLHRVSWLLFNRRDHIEARDVLVVGPNPAFLRYVSTVLPSLGDEAVVQLPATDLGPRVPIGRVDPPEVRRVKGDRRMLRFVLRGLRNRQRVSRVPAELTVDGCQVVVETEQLVSRARQLTGQPHNEARRHLRTFLVDEVHRQLTRRRLREPPSLDAGAQTEVAREVDAYLDRAWPKMSPQGFLAELLSTRRRREVAAAGLLTTREIDLLALPQPQEGASLSWSTDDIPLLDLADSLLNGTSATYRYIVVDEAQDLSPMQFESIRRRSRTGWMTVLGDLAQATSPWAPPSWEEVAQLLRRDQVPSEITALSLGYRLPTEVHEVAMRLLPAIAPDLQPPQPVRSTGDPVAVTAVRPGEVPSAVAQAVRACGSGLVGVITPVADLDRVRDAIAAAGLACTSDLDAFPDSPVVVLGCRDAKGLEFDHVVVVEPAAIVAESARGLRGLFVALTRPTRRLAVVHAEPLPGELGLRSPVPGNDRSVGSAGAAPEGAGDDVHVDAVRGTGDGTGAGDAGDVDDIGDGDDVDDVDDVDDATGVTSVDLARSTPGGAGTEYDDWWPDERSLRTEPAGAPGDGGAPPSPSPDDRRPTAGPMPPPGRTEPAPAPGTPVPTGRGGGREPATGSTDAVPSRAIEATAADDPPELAGLPGLRWADTPPPPEPPAAGPDRGERGVADGWADPEPAPRPRPEPPMLRKRPEGAEPRHDDPAAERPGREEDAVDRPWTSAGPEWTDTGDVPRARPPRGQQPGGSSWTTEQAERAERAELHATGPYGPADASYEDGRDRPAVAEWPGPPPERRRTEPPTQVRPTTAEWRRTEDLAGSRRDWGDEPPAVERRAWDDAAPPRQGPPRAAAAPPRRAVPDRDDERGPVAPPGPMPSGEWPAYPDRAAPPPAARRDPPPSGEWPATRDRERPPAPWSGAEAPSGPGREPWDEPAPPAERRRPPRADWDEAPPAGDRRRPASAEWDQAAAPGEPRRTVSPGWDEPSGRGRPGPASGPHDRTDWPAAAGRGQPGGAPRQWTGQTEAVEPTWASERGDVGVGTQRHEPSPARREPAEPADRPWEEPARPGDPGAPWDETEAGRPHRPPPSPGTGPERLAAAGPMEPSRLRWPEPPPALPPRPEPRPRSRPERADQPEWDERSLPARRSEPADEPSAWREAPPARRPADPGHRPADPGRRDRPASGRPGTIILNPSGSGTNGTGADDFSGDATGGEDPRLTGERQGFPLPAQSSSNGIDLRVDPFAALDREMARAIARKLAEALERYATPALVPLVVDQMAEILEVDKPRVTRTGKDSTPP